jgi:pyridoxal phosphate enzyme (YggS family)
VQEAVEKMPAVELPLRWHLIGHLQRNKVKYLDRFVMLHSLDSARLADAVSEWAVRVGRTVSALVQVNVSGEAAKGGYAPAELEREAARLRALPGLRVDGVMTMAPFDADERTLRAVFSGARVARETLAAAGHPAAELSMGMSNDYEVAVEEGATLVRLGTVLFGARDA